jgi:2-polyprenyl-6-methoxyphenol hydroxylase-like FAD-dependent oxidoreductase
MLVTNSLRLIAGPTLAYWLQRYGFRPTVVERAPRLREDGAPVDVRGQAVGVAERMGILSRIRQARTDIDTMSFVDGSVVGAGGEEVASIAMSAFQDNNDVELMRGDLARILYDATREEVEYRFGDSIRAMRQDSDGVSVTFHSVDERRFDLVVGADGLHSAVRRLEFGAEKRFLRHLGYYVAVATVPSELGPNRRVVLYNAPGKAVFVYRSGNHSQAKGLFLFRQDELSYDHRDVPEQKRLLAATFDDEAWQIPRLLAEVMAGDDFYFDSVSQIRMPWWSRGRVALLGDAAYCPALLSGAGSTLAMVGAYLLANALASCGDDYRAAFCRYEDTYRPVVTRSEQSQAHGQNPRTGRQVRDRCAEPTTHSRGSFQPPPRTERPTVTVTV